ncbi:MAG TPA: DUF998 domain-containing protein [Rhodanobacteraceae bacterium]|nr:DUF998 domain-containing protein [Rhodanobacteraceae bacterium]
MARSDIPRHGRPTPPHGGLRATTDPVARACGIVTLVGVAIITVISLVAQFLRTDLNWLTVQLSFYAKGPYGAWVQAGFFAPAPGLAALGIGWYRELDGHAHNVAPLALFVVAAIALCFTAAYFTDPTEPPTTLHGKIHEWAAFGTFVCATTAMLVQSWRLRLDPRWRKHFLSAFVLAVITAIYFWIYALVKPIPRGLGEKAVIALVLLWVWRSAWWLARGPADR